MRDKTTTALNMKVATWNVNGVRSLLTKEKDGSKHPKPIPNNVLHTFLKEQSPDVVCLQEIKCSKDADMAAVGSAIEGYHMSINCSRARKGYSGVAILSKTPPIKVTHGMDPARPLGGGPTEAGPESDLDKEGRVLMAEFDRVRVVCVYTPNSKADLSRLPFRTEVWDVRFREYVKGLTTSRPIKPVVVCGDLNVAHEPIDLHNPKANEGEHGYTVQEREGFALLLKEAKLVDAYRHLYPQGRAYTWFSPFIRSKARNKGWRIDYILSPASQQSAIQAVQVMPEYYGSDHVPVMSTFAWD